MDPLVVFRRTEAGDALAKRPREIKVIEWRAVLLLVDGTLPVHEMQQRFGNALDVIKILEAMQAEGLVERAPLAPAMSEDLPEPVEPGWFKGKGENADDAGAAAAAEAAPPPPREPAPPPPPKRRSGGISRQKVTRIAVGAIVAAGVVSAFMLPGLVQPEVEASLSRVLGTPVKVGGASLSFSHGPGVALSKVRIGEAPDLELREIVLQPSLTYFLGGRSVSAWISNAELPVSSAAQLADIAEKLPRLKAVRFEHLSVAGLPVPALQGNLQIGGEGGTHFALADSANEVHVEARSNSGGLDLKVFAERWQIPLFGTIPAEGVQLDGRLTDHILDVTHYSMAAYNGRIEGEARFVLDKSLEASGSVRTFGVEANALIGKLDSQSRTHGALTSDLQFKASGTSFTTLDHLSLSGLVKLERGSLVGIDIPIALRERAASPSAGGETPFESLEGSLVYNDSGTVFRLEKLNANALSGSGEVRLDDSTPPKLSGRLQLEVSGSDRKVRAPAFLDGTLSYPRIQVAAVTVRPD